MLWRTMAIGSLGLARCWKCREETLERRLLPANPCLQPSCPVCNHLVPFALDLTFPQQHCTFCRRFVSNDKLEGKRYCIYCRNMCALCASPPQEQSISFVPFWIPQSLIHCLLSLPASPSKLQSTVPQFIANEQMPITPCVWTLTQLWQLDTELVSWPLTPKSLILQLPLVFSSRFEGLMSRCTTRKPLCRCNRPATTWEH